jgi:uncharacterized protein
LEVPIACSAQTPPITGPSFSCGSANNAIETTICSDAALAARDRTMATLFNTSQADAFNRGKSQQQILQRQWLKTRLADVYTHSGLTRTPANPLCI